MSQPAVETPAALGADAQYRLALDEGKFIIQQCLACSEHVFYPRMICPHCGSDQLQWREPTGKGVVYSTTVIRRKPEDGGDYNVAIITLEEGVRVMSRVDSIPPEQVVIDLAVQAQVVQQEGQGLLTFIPQGGAR